MIFFTSREILTLQVTMTVTLFVESIDILATQLFLIPTSNGNNLFIHLSSTRRGHKNIVFIVVKLDFAC